MPLLSTFAVFAVGFFMRPVGGLLMGAVADRHGRRAALTVTILLMGGSSLLVGLTPTYASMGVLAPVILVLARLLQGLSVGGEFAASTTFLVKSAGPGRRGLFSSLQYVSTTVGQLVAFTWGDTHRPPSPAAFLRSGLRAARGAAAARPARLVRRAVARAVRGHGAVDRLHLDQRSRERRDLPAPGRRGGHRLPVLPDGGPLRRHGPVRGHAVQGAGARGAVPLVRRGDLSGVVGGVPAAAGDGSRTAAAVRGRAVGDRLTVLAVGLVRLLVRSGAVG